MSLAKKVVLVPPANDNNLNFQIGGGEIRENVGELRSKVLKSNKFKSKLYDKMQKFFIIILKLARKYGYDDALRIRLKNGSYLEKSNVIDLLNNAMSIGKVLYGETEFIELLQSSNINPDLIINDNVRKKLIQLSNKTYSNVSASSDNSNTDRRIENRKRHLSDDLEDTIERKKSKVDDNLDDNQSDSSNINTVKSGKRKADEIELPSKVLRRSYSDIEDDQIDKNLWEIPSD